MKFENFEIDVEIYEPSQEEISKDISTNSLMINKLETILKMMVSSNSCCKGLDEVEKLNDEVDEILETYKLHIEENTKLSLVKENLDNTLSNDNDVVVINDLGNTIKDFDENSSLVKNVQRKFSQNSPFDMPKDISDMNFNM